MKMANKETLQNVYYSAKNEIIQLREAISVMSEELARKSYTKKASFSNVLPPKIMKSNN
jgi:hypothetical protein